MPDRLQQAITVLQTRFGSAAPRPAAPPCPARPTGIPELDALTGIRVLACAGVDLVCIDLPRARSGLDAELPHLLHRAAEADCTLLLVHDAEADDAIRYYASLILSFQRSAWVFRRDGDLEGLQVDATVVKNRLAPPGLKKQWVVAYPIP